jgi:hypothetical protein
MSSRTSARLTAAASAAAFTALLLSGCGGSTKQVTSPTASTTPPASHAASTTGSAASPTPVPPGPAFTAAVLDHAVLTAKDLGGPPYGAAPLQDQQSAYPFGCITSNRVGDTAQTHPTSGRPSGKQTMVAGLVVPTSATGPYRLKSVYEQYVLFPDAQAAATEQQTIEASVTSACLQPVYMPSAGGWPAYTITNSRSPFNNGGFTGTELHAMAASDTTPSGHTEVDAVEARDGSLLVVVFFTHDTDQAITDYDFQSDASTVISKAVDKLAATGH